jgi:ketosteroid isomerase-like protein
MKRIAGAGFALLVVLAAGGCPPRAATPAAAQVAEPAADVLAKVLGTIEQWRQAYEVRSMDALARLYAHETGLTVITDGTLQVGWVSIEAALGARIAHATAIRVRIKDPQVTALGPAAAVATAVMAREVTEGATTAAENGVVTLVLRTSGGAAPGSPREGLGGDTGWVIVAEHYSYKRP